MTQTLLLSVTGVDQPGVTRTLFQALPVAVQVLDIEQVVIDGYLQLGVLISLPEAELISVADDVRAALVPMGLNVSSSSHASTAVKMPQVRHRVSVMGNPLQSGAIAKLTSAIRMANGNIERIERVAEYPVTALQFKVSGANSDVLKPKIAEFSSDYKVDVAVQELNLNRRGRQLVVMDVDSTVIQNEVIELIAEHAGVQAEVKKITDAAMAGELDFEQSLRARVKLLTGIPDTVFKEVYEKVQLTPGAKTLCKVLNSLGYEIALVSGGFTEVVSEIANELGVSHFRANQLEVVDGKLTGGLVGKIVDRAAKAEYLQAFAEQFDIPLERTIAIGDGANDLDMMQIAGLGIAFNAKPVVQAAADVAINAPYLDTVLYLLGITRAEIEALKQG